MSPDRPFAIGVITIIAAQAMSGAVRHKRPFSATAFATMRIEVACTEAVARGISQGVPWVA
jgi:hypothetical protein